MKIHCKYNDKELIGENNVISLNSQSQTLSIFIGVNGDYTCNDFYVYGGDDWLTYNRMGNEIKIKAKSNYNYNRDTSLYFTHTWNKNVMCILNIKQEGLPSELKVDKTEIEFQSLLGEENKLKEPETANITVECVNGDLIIEPIKLYINGKESVYDNGVCLKKEGNNIQLINYGKPNLLTEDFYYELILKNSKDFTKKQVIKINYNKDYNNIFAFED